MSSIESKAAEIAIAKLLESASANIPSGVITGCILAGALEGYVTGRPHSLISASKSGLSIFLFSACTSGTSAGPENRVGAHIIGRALDGIPLLKDMSFKMRTDNTPGAGAALTMLALLSIGSYLGAEIRKQQRGSGYGDPLGTLSSIESKLAERYKEHTIGSSTPSAYSPRSSDMNDIKNIKPLNLAEAKPSCNIKDALAVIASCGALTKDNNVNKI